VISDQLLALARCPRCLLQSDGQADPPALCREGQALRCPACGSRYPCGDAILDLRPPDGVDGRETRYAADADEFAAALDYRAVGEPLLGAAVRERWLRRWLPLGPGKLILDIGAGDGRFALWSRRHGAHIISLDAAPFFANAALAELDLALGDVRALPFPTGAFDAAYSIDVMEHLDAPGLERFFAEAARVLKPGGSFYLYSNTRERSTLWPIIALWGWLSRLLRRRNIGDFHTDDLRKSDHVKVLTTWPQVVAFAAHHGLRVEQVRFWNGVFQGLIDNVLVRVGEGVLLGRRFKVEGPRSHSGTEEALPSAGFSARQEVSRRPVARVALLLLTALMQLDITIFGRLRSGPFFALLRKGVSPPPPPNAGGSLRTVSESAPEAEMQEGPALSLQPRAFAHSRQSPPSIGGQGGATPR
jgi:SAM-dependent methyltransferase